MLTQSQTDPLALPGAMEDYVAAQKDLTPLEAKLYRYVWESVIRPGDRIFTVASDEDLAQALSVNASDAKNTRCSLSEKGLIVTIIKTRSGKCVMSSDAPIWKAVVGQYGLSLGVPNTLLGFLKYHDSRPSSITPANFFVELMSAARVQRHGAMITGKKRYPEDVLQCPRGS